MNPVTFLDEYRRKKTEAADAVYRDEQLALELRLRSPIDEHPFSSSLYAVVERLDRLFRLNPDRTMFQAESELRDIADCLEQPCHRFLAGAHFEPQPPNTDFSRWHS